MIAITRNTILVTRTKIAPNTIQLKPNLACSICVKVMFESQLWLYGIWVVEFIDDCKKLESLSSSQEELPEMVSCWPWCTVLVMAIDDVETDDVDGAMFSSDVGLLDVTDTAEVMDVVDSFTETPGTVQGESVTGINVRDNTTISQERDCNNDQVPRGVPQETASNSTL
jgi:hypothetical protein